MRIIKVIARIALGSALIFAGLGHFTFARATFQAQVPGWIPFDADFVVLASGAVEIALGIGLLTIKKYRKQIGWLTAGFFLAIFPGNMVTPKIVRGREGGYSQVMPTDTLASNHLPVSSDEKHVIDLVE